VSALMIVPAASAQAAASWRPPEYSATKVVEQAVTVGPLALPGTLVRPEGTGPFPAAVLVHGSGPNDADETLGPNKPFRDLALGLAAHGIATIRYEKRTHAHPATFTPDHQYTVNEEAVDDAVAAVRLAAGTPGLDGKRVWVIGHSWGGTLGPRIAAASPEVAGVVILAGSTRPLEDLLVEQMAYLQGPGSPGVAAAEATARAVRDPKLGAAQVVDVLGAKLPGSYFLDLRAYDPAKTAAKLHVPILVLWGERDYQVRRADYDGWAHALAGHPHTRLKTYPSLNHLFEDGHGPSRPEEYQRPDMHVAGEVVTDIAAFINKGGP
jgi:dienelactone hydrolase